MNRAPRLPRYGKIGQIALYAAMLALSLAFLFRFYWLATSAFKNQGEIFTLPPHWLPIPLRLAYFTAAFRETNLLRAFIISVLIAAGHVALMLYLCSLAGYAFAKFPHA